ncbi:phosphatase [Pantoea phage Phynn]|nr:phosphatase [Pantoea phage Phynn]
MILFDINDVFNEFTVEFEKKFGVKPNEIPRAEYDQKIGTLAKTDFYKNLPRRQAGIDLYLWATTYGDRQTELLLFNEKVSPLTVSYAKMQYADQICAELCLPRQPINRVSNETELAGHAWRGVFVSGNEHLRKAWDSAGKYSSVSVMTDDFDFVRRDIDDKMSNYNPASPPPSAGL